MTGPFDDVIVDIAPADEMYATALRGFKNPGLARAVYLRQGLEICDSVRRLLDWRFDDRLGKVKFLDFASGFGRSTRFLVNVLPPANIWVSDIDKDAVDFQKRVFGVNGFPSVTRPEKLNCSERFDFIFVASLFSHLPERRFVPWLRRLFDLLAPKGILAFSVHDEATAIGRDVSRAGILFSPASESNATLDPDEYGSTYVAERYVAGAIRQVAGSGWPYRRLARALCGAQDLYIVSRDPAERFETFEYTFPPVGYVEHFVISPRLELRIDGWAADPNEGSELDAVEVMLNDQVLTRIRPTLPRGYVARALGDQRFATSGWMCVHQLRPKDLKDRDAMVEVRAISTSGSSSMLHLSPLSSAERLDAYPPIGYVEHLVLSPELELRIDGWAADPNDGPLLDRVEVKLNDRVVATTRPSIRTLYVARALDDQRFAYSGWACVHPLRPEDLEHHDATIEVRAVSTSGLSAVLHRGPLPAAPRAETSSATPR